MNLGNILNGFVKDALTFWLVCAGAAIALTLFSLLYNRWMEDLGERKQGYTAFLVALGNGITLLAVALVSWKASVLVMAAFVVSGTAMIAGDIKRSAQARVKVSKKGKRKPLPYAASGLLDEGLMLLADANRAIKGMLAKDLDGKRLGLVGVLVTEAIAKIQEARKVEGE